jgi:hypothetical protein
VYEILSSNGDFVKKFEKKLDVKKAMFFLGKSDLLFTLACDYPGFYKMDMAYVAAARKELKRLGFQPERGKLMNPVYTYRIFYFGPKPNRQTYGTPLYNATSFKIYFYGFPEGDSVVK